MLFRDLEFSLDSGQVLQVKGGNGSGKTTLLRIICGLNDGFEGEIFWQGASPAQARERFHAELLYIGHRAGVNKVLTPLENLRWGCSLHRVVADADIRSALAETGLAGYEESQCFTLSAGQQQRVALARLLLSEAALWVLDEPFTTLDANGIEMLESLVTEHARKGGAVLITTHHKLAIGNLRTLTLGVSE